MSTSARNRSTRGPAKPPKLVSSTGSVTKKCPAPGMTTVRTKKPACLSAEERRRLRRRIDDVVVGAVDQQEARRVPVHGRVADRRGFEEHLAVGVRRGAQEFLGDVVARPRHQVVLPLRQHVVDAVEADHCLDLGRHRGVGVGAVFAGIKRLLAGQRHQRRKVRAGASRRPARCARDRRQARRPWRARTGSPPWCRRPRPDRSSRRASSAGIRWRTRRCRSWRDTGPSSYRTCGCRPASRRRAPRPAPAPCRRPFGE